ncbi:MAG: PD40 domain-containing protein, partial [Bacteroidales bacterium]|nr:PD40 domain-containing protein [Bacteroidales bacterium]
MKIAIKKILSLPATMMLIAFTAGIASAQSAGQQNFMDLIKVDRFSLDVVSPSSGVQFYRDGIVFLSDTKNEARMLESHTSFGKIDTYYAVPLDTVTGSRNLFSPTLSWQVPTEAMTFNYDYTVMYYTRKPSSREPEKIFKARYELARNKKHEWISDTKPVSFCSDRSLYSHPALSPDGEKMVFSSNRSESLGGLDLFISYREGTEWSAPINLGNLINTKGDELTPFLDQDNNLYFSSDGISGSGGHDIFFCRYNGGKWDKPANLTELINTPDDDLAFKLSLTDGKSAFFTTRYKQAGKAPQLFKVTLRDQMALGNAGNLQEVFSLIARTVITAEEEVIPVAVIQEEPEPVVQEALPPVEKPVQKVAEEAKVADPVPVEVKTQAAPDPDAIVFRVQFQATSAKRADRTITIGGKKYDVFEYFSNGTYKSCAGEFLSPSAAAGLQAQLRREGYSDAFVVAFRNNERITGSLQNIIASQASTPKPA